MEILISANEQILSMSQSLNVEISETMTEQQFLQWFQIKEKGEGEEHTGYKGSQFNYVQQTEKGFLVYNTLYNSLSRVSDKEYGQYMRLEFESDDIRRQFVNQGIIVDKCIDECQRYRIYTELAAQYSKCQPSITVTPTMECNARCFYCYEDGVRFGDMEKESADKIIRKIKALDCSRGINLTWFGGEPLMNQEWMDYFSGCLRAENINFSAFLISNGSKIDDHVIARMKNVWNVKSVQISFDGSKDEYVRRKAYIDQDENVYYRILYQIRHLSKAGISVQVRLNIDRDNIDSIVEMVSHLTLLYKDDVNITCYPAFLTGCSSPLSEREKTDIIKRIIEAGGNKIHVNNYLYKLPKTMTCYYNQRNAFSIDANGDIFICEHLLGHTEEAVGNINDTVDLTAVERTLSGRRTECQECVFLPKCLGGCTNTYRNGEVPCFIDKYMIKAYLELL